MATPRVDHDQPQCILQDSDRISARPGTGWTIHFLAFQRSSVYVRSFIAVVS